jgi:hypothetical protein
MITLQTYYGRKWRIHRYDVDLNNPIYLDDQVKVQYRDSAECDVCDGTGNCPHCHGESDLCERCFDGDCPECDGDGWVIVWEDAYMPRADYDEIVTAEHEREITHTLLEARYGTPEPESIRDFWA